MSGKHINLVLARRGRSRAAGRGARDVTGFRKALGDAAVLSGLTVSFYLTSLEKILAGLENQRRLGHSPLAYGTLGLGPTLARKNR